MWSPICCRIIQYNYVNSVAPRVVTTRCPECNTLYNKFFFCLLSVGSEAKVPPQQPQHSVVFIPHPGLGLTPGVQMAPAAATAGGLPGGGAQIPLAPPPKPPLSLQAAPAPAALVPPPAVVPQPLPPPPALTPAPVVPTSNTQNGGQIPSLLSLPVAPTKDFTQKRKYRKLFFLQFYFPPFQCPVEAS